MDYFCNPSFWTAVASDRAAAVLNKNRICIISTDKLESIKASKTSKPVNGCLLHIPNHSIKPWRKDTTLINKNILVVDDNVTCSGIVVTDKWYLSDMLNTLNHNTFVNFVFEDKDVFIETVSEFNEFLLGFKCITLQSTPKEPSGSKYTCYGIHIIPLHLMYPIYKPDKIDGIAVMLTTLHKSKCKRHGKPIVINFTSYICNNYLDNIFYLDGVTLSTPMPLKLVSKPSLVAKSIVNTVRNDYKDKPDPIPTDKSSLFSKISQELGKYKAEIEYVDDIQEEFDEDVDVPDPDYYQQDLAKAFVSAAKMASTKIHPHSSEEDTIQNEIVEENIGSSQPISKAYTFSSDNTSTSWSVNYETPSYKVVNYNSNSMESKAVPTKKVHKKAFKKSLLKKTYNGTF